MDNDRIAYNFAVGSQGFEGSFEDFKNLDDEERNKYEEGANGGLIKEPAKPDEYEGWYDCVSDKYDPTGEVPYKDEADFLDMCKQNWDEIEIPDLTADIDGKIYAVDIDGNRELVLVKRVKKELD